MSELLFYVLKILPQESDKKEFHIFFKDGLTGSSKSIKITELQNKFEKEIGPKYIWIGSKYIGEPNTYNRVKMVFKKVK